MLQLEHSGERTKQRESCFRRLHSRLRPGWPGAPSRPRRSARARSLRCARLPPLRSPPPLPFVVVETTRPRGGRPSMHLLPFVDTQHNVVRVLARAGGGCLKKEMPFGTVPCGRAVPPDVRRCPARVINIDHHPPPSCRPQPPPPLSILTKFPLPPPHPPSLHSSSAGDWRRCRRSVRGQPP